ncbi:hypothetical protein D3C84_973590 [compost metagenome]
MIGSDDVPALLVKLREALYQASPLLNKIVFPAFIKVRAVEIFCLGAPADNPLLESLPDVEK